MHKVKLTSGLHAADSTAFKPNINPFLLDGLKLIHKLIPNWLNFSMNTNLNPNQTFGLN